MKTEGDKVCESNLLSWTSWVIAVSQSLDHIQCECGLCPFRCPGVCCFISVCQGVQRNLGYNCGRRQEKGNMFIFIFLSWPSTSFLNCQQQNVRDHCDQCGPQLILWLNTVYFLYCQNKQYDGWCDCCCLEEIATKYEMYHVDVFWSFMCMYIDMLVCHSHLS